MSDSTPATRRPANSVIDEVVERRRHVQRHPGGRVGERETRLRTTDRGRERGLELKPCAAESGAAARRDTGRPGKPGLLSAGSDAFDIGIEGPGGHGGLMARAGNVLAPHAFSIARLHTIVDGLEHEGTGSHTTVGNVIRDGAWNIVPRGVKIKGS